jgi:hypothetical protein
MKAMISMTPAEGKRLIARAIASMPEIVRARESGKILIKGGTSASAVAEELVGAPIKISGRISPRGFRATRGLECGAPHCMLIEGGAWRNVDAELPQVVAGMGRDDVVVTGANLIDAFGGAAVVAGAPLGDRPGAVMSGIMSEGITVILAVGLEKLIPGTVSQAVRAAGRKSADLSTGMAVGLMPIFGRIVTELEALKILAPVECQVIARGGIDGAEGATSIAFWGEEGAVRGLFDLVLELKGATVSGDPVSLVECEAASPTCKGHRACIYRSPGLLRRASSSPGGGGSRAE